MDDISARGLSSDPITDQTDEAIEAYLRSLSPGDAVAIRTTYAHSISYEIATVQDVGPRGRFYTDFSYAWGGSGWYMKSGKNCRAPTGQARACIPTDAVYKFIEAHPLGRF